MGQCLKLLPKETLGKGEMKYQNMKGGHQFVSTLIHIVLALCVTLITNWANDLMVMKPIRIL